MVTRVAAAAAVPEGEHKSRLPDKSSIFSAELRAILLALDCADVSWKTQFILFSDSLSSLQAIHNLKTDHPIVRQVLERHNRLSLSGKEMIFCWLPSHTGITGNDRADNAAKAALEVTQYPTSTFVTLILNPTINTFIHYSMQSRWDVLVDNKLHAIKPTLGEWTPGFRNVRRDEVVLSRLRIGHTRLTHSYLLKREPRPRCIPCDSDLTVKHILLDCIDLTDTRRKYFNVSSLAELFQGTDIEALLHFLKEINLYRKI